MISRTQDEIMENWPKDWNTPLVSIRCITYNHESYIAQALDSFLIQETDFPFEIIIHDFAVQSVCPVYGAVHIGKCLCGLFSLHGLNLL